MRGWHCVSSLKLAGGSSKFHGSVTLSDLGHINTSQAPHDGERHIDVFIGKWSAEIYLGVRARAISQTPSLRRKPSKCSVDGPWQCKMQASIDPTIDTITHPSSCSLAPTYKRTGPS